MSITVNYSSMNAIVVSDSETFATVLIDPGTFEPFHNEAAEVTLSYLRIYERVTSAAILKKENQEKVNWLQEGF